jgi:hypothetical protein
LSEATEVLIARLETTATTISLASEKMIRRLEMFERLKGELKEAGLKTEEDYVTRNLEQLPFLVCTQLLAS